MQLPDRPPSRPERPRIYLDQDGTAVLQANPTSSAIPVPNVRPLRPPNLHPRRIKVLRFTSSGIAVANLRVAVTQRIQQDGE
jgi:hypothetical protein